MVTTKDTFWVPEPHVVDQANTICWREITTVPITTVPKETVGNKANMKEKRKIARSS